MQLILTPLILQADRRAAPGARRARAEGSALPESPRRRRRGKTRPLSAIIAGSRPPSTGSAAMSTSAAAATPAALERDWPTPSARSPWTRCRRRTPATPACRWAWPRSPRCCGAATCATTRPIPRWADRDRFVLSNGHGSMLLYALLHLTGYDLPMDELERFRQLHSKTPGHPEFGCTPGVETTTGPLGQGLANAVGMALAERLLAAEFNRPGHDDRRPPHLRLPRRRLPDGRHLARGLLARRHARAWAS